MSTELVRRAKVLRLCKRILGDESKEQDMEQLIHALEVQGSHIEGLVRQEESLKHILNPNPNVIPLQPRPKVFKTSSSQMKVFEKRFVVETPCLIEGSTQQERKKLAFEIHSRTSKTIFIDLTHLDSLWNSKMDGLEGSTLFISSLEKLTSVQLEKLTALMACEDCPLVISATAKTYAELKSIFELSPALLSSLSQAHFRLQRPVKEYLEMGFFKLFLESLS